MKKSLPFLALAAFSLAILFTACEKEDDETSVSPVPPKAKAKPPVARAGNDTTIYIPFSTYTLDGWASTDPNSNRVSYSWRRIAGPSVVEITTSSNSSRGHVSGLFNLGVYDFELTVKGTDGLSSKDTVSVTVAEPNCTSVNKEVILKDLRWDYSWMMEIAIYNPFSYLPPNSHLTNIYIKRDNSSVWEVAVPLNWNSPDYGQVPEWDYGNGVLVIYPGKDVTDDTPDIKLQYCQ